MNRKKNILTIGGEEVRMGAPNDKNKKAVFLRSAYLDGIAEQTEAEDVFVRYFSKSVPAYTKQFTQEEYDILLKGVGKRMKDLAAQTQVAYQERGNTPSVRSGTEVVTELTLIKDTLASAKIATAQRGPKEPAPDVGIPEEQPASILETAVEAIVPAVPVTPSTLTDDELKNLTQKFAVLLLHYQRPITGMNAYTQPAKNIISRVQSVASVPDIKKYVDSYREDGGILNPLIDDILSISLFGSDVFRKKIYDFSYETILKEMMSLAEVEFAFLPEIRERLLKEVVGGTTKEKIAAFLNILFHLYSVAKEEVVKQNKQAEQLQIRVDELMKETLALKLKAEGVDDIKVLKDSFDALKVEKTGLDTKVTLLEGQLKRLEDEKLADDATIARITGEFKDLKSQHDAGKAAASVAAFTLAATKAKLSKANELIKEKDASGAETKKKLDEELVRSATLESAVTAAGVRIGALEAASGTDKAGSAVALAELAGLKSKFQDLSGSYSESLAKVRDLSNNLARAKADSDKLSREYVDLSGSAILLRQQVVDLSGQLRGWKDYGEQAEQYKTQIEQKVTDLSGSLAKSVRNYLDLSGSTVALREEVAKKTGELNKWQEFKVVNENFINEIQDDLEKSGALITDLSGQVQQFKADKEITTAQLSILDKTKEDLRLEKLNYGLLYEFYQDLSANKILLENEVISKAESLLEEKKIVEILNEQIAKRDSIIARWQETSKINNETTDGEIQLLKDEIAAKEREKDAALASLRKAHAKAMEKQGEQETDSLFALDKKLRQDCDVAVAKAKTEQAAELKVSYDAARVDAVAAEKTRLVGEKRALLDAQTAETARVKDVHDKAISSLTAQRDAAETAKTTADGKLTAAQAAAAKLTEEKGRAETASRSLITERDNALEAKRVADEQLATARQAASTIGTDRDTLRKDKAKVDNDLAAAQTAAAAAATILATAQAQLTAKTRELTATEEKISSLARQILAGNFSSTTFVNSKNQPIRNILQRVQTLSQSSGTDEGICNLVLILNYFFVRLFTGNNNTFYSNANNAVIQVLEKRNQLKDIIRVVTQYLTFSEKILFSGEAGYYFIDEPTADKDLMENVFQAIDEKLQSNRSTAHSILARSNVSEFSLGFYRPTQNVQLPEVSGMNLILFDPKETTFKSDKKVSYPYDDKILNRYKIVNFNRFTQPDFSRLTDAAIGGGFLTKVQGSRTVTHSILFAFLLVCLQRNILEINRKKAIACEIPSTLQNPTAAFVPPPVPAQAPPASRIRTPAEIQESKRTPRPPMGGGKLAKTRRRHRTEPAKKKSRKNRK